MDKTDRELLEAAAKAAGIELRYWAESQESFNLALTEPRRWWNPLADDGDALRLAVQLDLTIQRPWMDDDRTDTREVRVWSHEPEYVHESLVGVDKAAATRRAIVRAAASMGENNGNPT